MEYFYALFGFLLLGSLGVGLVLGPCFLMFKGGLKIKREGRHEVGSIYRIGYLIGSILTAGICFFALLPLSFFIDIIFQIFQIDAPEYMFTLLLYAVYGVYFGAMILPFFLQPYIDAKYKRDSGSDTVKV